MKQELLKQLKSDYEKLEIKPSADLWDRIDQIDQKEEKSSILIPKKPFRWLKYAAVVVLLLSLGALLYFNKNHPVHLNNPVAHKEQAKEKVEITLPNPDINVSEDTEVKNRKDQKMVKENLDIPEFYQHEEIAEEKTLLGSQKEQVIVANERIKAPVLEKSIEIIPETMSIAEKKKTEYIKADELLQGREFQKKREEHRTDIRKFGALDITKIKVKSPSSFKVLGMTVYSDSLESK
ncbi:hypothetical protein [Chryseobacterium sp.]|uniref:hypothetical protein n=1 Tax=Chryseobacterium sp. TaxID=1871047 RepID=UPI001B200EA1|nr:hypothetical protein [Chryseobacterium sp.]MBO9690934.1 hypothetical protein [Chryseobacterium sp.]